MASFDELGIFFGDQIFSRGDEIVKDVLLFQFDPGFVPFFAVFVAAANIGDGINAALFHPDEPRDRKSGCQRNVKTAVTVKQSRIRAVEFQAFFVNDEHRNARAVFAFVKDLFDFEIGRIHFNVGFAENFRFAGFHIVSVNRRRRVETRIGIKSFRVGAFAAETARRTDARKFDIADKFSVAVKNADLRVCVFEIFADELIVDKTDALRAFPSLPARRFSIFCL